MHSFDPVTARLILVLAEEGSIGRAGEKEHIAPSAVSRRLSDLEARIGVPLFDRSAQGVRPTRAGEAYLERARAVMREIADLDLVMGEYAEGRLGRLRLACTSAALSGRLPELLAVYTARYPAVDLDLSEAGAAIGLAALEDGLADVAVVSDNYDFTRFEIRPFEDDRVWVIVPPDHPLAESIRPSRPVAFASVVDHESIGIHHSGALDRLLNEHAAKRGRAVGEGLRVESFPALVRLVEAGFGIGFLRATSLHLLAGTDLLAAPIGDHWALRKLVVARRRNGPVSRPIADFLELCDASYVPTPA